MEQTKITKYINQNDIYPFNFDKIEMEKCENDFEYFFNEYYSKSHPELTLQEFNNFVSELKNPKSAIFKWCLGRIKRK